MKILLLSPSSENSTRRTPRHAFSYPLGIASLGATLQRDGHEVEGHDLFPYPWPEARARIAELVRKSPPDLVGISCLSMNRVAALDAARLLRELSPGTPVWMGGIHATALHEQILRHHPVDGIALGEADETFPAVVRALEASTAWQDLPGIAYRVGEDVRSNPHPGFVEDLDALPWPRHDFFRDYLAARRKGHLLSSRGCPMGCIFCSSTAFWGRRFRTRSPENIVEEMAYLKRDFDVEHIMFMDDIFTLNVPRTLEFCEKLSARGLGLTWECSTRVTAVNPEMLRQMKRSGCVHLALGVESASPAILERIGKRLTPEQIRRAFGWLEEAGISPAIYLMVGNPGESWGTVRETTELLKGIRTGDLFSVAVAQLYPNTELYRLALEGGLLDDSHWLSRKRVPYFTLEHGLLKLNCFADTVKYRSWMRGGLRDFLRCLRHYLARHRRWSLEMLLRLLLCPPFLRG